MRVLLVSCGLAAAAAAGAAAPAAAQLRPSVEGATTASLGQPVSWKGTLTGGAVLRQGSTAGAEGGVGLQRDLLNPVFGLFSAHGEVYVARRERDFEPGIRARVLSPFARLGAGIDYNMVEERADLVLSAFHPVRRSGVFGDGSMVRADYLPGRSHAVVVGIEKPIRRRIPMGGSRPRHDRVGVPVPSGRVSQHQVGLPDESRVAHLADAARRVRRMLLPLPPYEDDHRAGFEAKVRRFHRELDAAFAWAIGERLAADGASAISDRAVTDVAAAVSARARAVLLRDVLLPYNRMLGQTKEVDTVLGFGEIARGNFLRWLHVDGSVPRERRERVVRVFDALVAIVEANRAGARAEWRDSRFVWLPLQYALLPEQHDTQAELESIVAQAVRDEFHEGNFVSWVVNEQFQYHLSRTIRSARSYHVLWTHDYRGFDDHGAPDEMAYRHVVRSYLRALTERVRDYDSAGTFPTYIVLLDQWFYEVNSGRLWMTLLEDPLRHELTLTPRHRAWQDTIRAAQDELRRAVAESTLLQEQRAQYGDAWLHNLIKVHVNITNPADPTFWSTRVIRGIPLPDNMARDHRKLVFYDLTEDDPYVGEAIFTGAGIGEHYTNLSWEDRSLLVQGPAVLGLKQAARELLLNQGMKAQRIPYALQPRPLAPDYHERVAAVRREWQPLRALTVHNGAGFNQKDVNLAKAVLYTLMPAGSVIKIPDSLWNNELWASAMVGCALRGVRVLLIAPARANAPVDRMGTVPRSSAVLARVMSAQEQLAPAIAEAEGLLKVGVYAPQLLVSDLPAKVKAVHATFAQHAWLRDLFAFPQSVYDDLALKAALLEEMLAGVRPPDRFEHDLTPKLHLKANFFASREAWTLMTRPEWADASWTYLLARLTQIRERDTTLQLPDSIAEQYPDVGTAMVQDWLETLDDATRDRVSFFLVVGSHNQNSRSMIVDAEVGFVLAGWPSIIPYIDLIVIMGQTVWVEDIAGLERLVPAERGWQGRLARWIKLTM